MKSRISRRPSICFVSPTAYSIIARDRHVRIVGGAELQQVIIARELARRGYKVSMICADHGQEDAIRFDGITVLKCFAFDDGLPGIRAFYPRLFRMWAALRRADADIYYQRTAGRYTGVVAAFAKLYSKRAVYAAANDPDFEEGLPKIRFDVDKRIFTYGIRHVDRVIVQNAHQSRLCLEQFGRQAEVIPNCLDFQSESTARRDGEVLWVSTLKEEKRPGLFLDLAMQHPDYRFRMIGGPSRYGNNFYEEIRDRAQNIPNLEFTGFVPYEDVGEYFDNAKVLVNTSDYEGFPNTFLQAWSRQVPTISFVKVEILVNDESIGIAARSFTEMSALLSKFMGNDVAWRAAGEACQQYVNEYHSAEAVTQRVEDVFLGLSSNIEREKT